MRRIRFPRPLAAIAFAAAVACTGEPLALCACSRVPPHSILYGTVTDPSGAGVQGATVHLEVADADCQTARAALQGPTDGAGRYRLPIDRTGGGAVQCVRLSATAPAGSGFRNSDTTQFTIPAPEGFGTDSLRRDIALRP